MPVTLVIADIFEDHSSPLVQCLALDHRSDAGGLAREMDRCYGTNIMTLCPVPEVGGLSVMVGRGKLVINLITKNHQQDQPYWFHFISSIKRLRDFCFEFELPVVIMPHHLGCGYDQLQ